MKKNNKINNLPSKMKMKICFVFFIMFILGMVVGAMSSYDGAQKYYIQKTYEWSQELCPQMHELDIKPVEKWLQETI